MLIFVIYTARKKEQPDSEGLPDSQSTGQVYQSTGSTASDRHGILNEQLSLAMKRPTAYENPTQGHSEEKYQLHLTT